MAGLAAAEEVTLPSRKILYFAVTNVMTIPRGQLHRYLDRELKRQWKRYRKALRRCDKRFSDDSVHNTRVEARRLLSLLELLVGFGLDEDLAEARCLLKKHLNAFNKLRDIQVHLALVKPWRSRYEAAEQFYRRLKKREERAQKRAARKVPELETQSLLRCVESMRAAINRRRVADSSEQDWERVWRTADQAFAAVVRLQRRARPDDATSIHRTRIAFKRFRYIMESLTDLLPGISDRYLAALHAHQTMMGDIQDVEVLTAAFVKFAAKKQWLDRRQAVFRNYLEARRQALIRRYFRRANRLNRFWPPPGRGRLPSRRPTTEQIMAKRSVRNIH